jgi:hypothetical protein
MGKKYNEEIVRARFLNTLGEVAKLQEVDITVINNALENLKSNMQEFGLRLTKEFQKKLKDEACKRFQVEPNILRCVVCGRVFQSDYNLFEHSLRHIPPRLNWKKEEVGNGNQKEKQGS